jgi:hypothetical protein
LPDTAAGADATVLPGMPDGRDIDMTRSSAFDTKLWLMQTTVKS